MKEKLMYMGAGVGIVLFALFGLLPGSFLGGVMGLNIASALFDYPVSPGVLERMVVALSMLLGVLVSGVMFVAGGTTVGWLAGVLVEGVSATKKVAEGKGSSTHEA